MFGWSEKVKHTTTRKIRCRCKGMVKPAVAVLYTTIYALQLGNVQLLSSTRGDVLSA